MENSFSIKTASLFIAILLVSFSPYAMAQEKVEREEAIKASEVPLKALNFLKVANFSKKVRWYKEYGIHQQSVEAKVKFKKHLYSIEFDAEGELEDIEKKVKKLPEEVHAQLEKDLSSRFQKIRILKIQHQWFEEPAGLLPYFKHVERNAPSIDGYELIVEGYQKESLDTFEVTCDDQGRVLQVLKIVLRPTDNLDF